MSTYYKISGLKVRISDHEPNYSMDRQRGSNDIEIYTQDVSGKKISVPAQIERVCEKRGLHISLFDEILNTYPEEQYEINNFKDKIEVSVEIAEIYKSISGKGSMKKKEKFCEKHGVDSFKMSQGYYKVI